MEELLQAPTVGVGDAIVIDTFYNSLNQSDQDSLNSAASGNFLTKNTQEALTIIKNKSKVKAPVSSMNRPIILIQNGCETCGGPHAYYECQDAGGYTQKDVYATTGTYNAGGNSYQPQAFNSYLFLFSYCLILHDVLFPVTYTCGGSDLLLGETCTFLSHFNDSSPYYETFCFDIGEKSSGSTTSHSDHSLLEYESFCFDVDHIEEKSSGITNSHSDISLFEYESFHFDLSIDLLSLADRSDSHLEEFADELAHIISPLEYDHCYFVSPRSG
ncbi:hypothetical protein Tco_0530623 [Tanacetum coccineum]